MEFHESGLYNFIRRDFTGQYANAAYFYKYVAENGFPLSDNFDWNAHPTEIRSYTFPQAVSVNYALSIAGSGGQARLNIESDMEHGNAQGIQTYYEVSGDETIKDAIVEGIVPFFAGAVSSANYTQLTGALWNDRSSGNLFMWASHLYRFLNGIQDSTNAAAILANAQTVYTVRVQPDLCVNPGYPAGCTPDLGDSIPQTGTSKIRGVGNIYKDTSYTNVGCSFPASRRTAKAFMTSRKLEGMLQFYDIVPSSWAFRNQLFDYAYGSSQWVFGEMLTDNGTNVWTNNSLRYAMAMDYAMGCSTAGADWLQLNNVQTVWHPFVTTERYLGPLSASKKRIFGQILQRLSSGGGALDEFFHATIATGIYYILHPQASSLNTVPITGFVNNGGGSYTITWITPASTTGLRVKWGAKQIVDWIGFDPILFAPVGDVVNTQNWFASTDASSIPAPSPGSQSMTISTGTSGLTVANFMVKAYLSILTVTTSSPLTPATVNVAYSNTLSGAGGPPPKTRAGGL